MERLPSALQRPTYFQSTYLTASVHQLPARPVRITQEIPTFRSDFIDLSVGPSVHSFTSKSIPHRHLTKSIRISPNDSLPLGARRCIASPRRPFLDASDYSAHFSDSSINDSFPSIPESGSFPRRVNVFGHRGWSGSSSPTKPDWQQRPLPNSWRSSRSASSSSASYSGPPSPAAQNTFTELLDPPKYDGFHVGQVVQTPAHVFIPLFLACLDAAPRYVSTADLLSFQESIRDLEKSKPDSRSWRPCIVAEVSESPDVCPKVYAMTTMLDTPVGELPNSFASWIIPVKTTPVGQRGEEARSLTDGDNTTDDIETRPRWVLHNAERQWVIPFAFRPPEIRPRDNGSPSYYVDAVNLAKIKTKGRECGRKWCLALSQCSVPEGASWRLMGTAPISRSHPAPAIESPMNTFAPSTSHPDNRPARVMDHKEATQYFYDASSAQFHAAELASIHEQVAYHQRSLTALKEMRLTADDAQIRSYFKGYHWSRITSLDIRATGAAHNRDGHLRAEAVDWRSLRLDPKYERLRPIHAQAARGVNSATALSVRDEENAEPLLRSGSILAQVIPPAGDPTTAPSSPTGEYGKRSLRFGSIDPLPTAPSSPIAGHDLVQRLPSPALRQLRETLARYDSQTRNIGKPLAKTNSMPEVTPAQLAATRNPKPVRPVRVILTAAAAVSAMAMPHELGGRPTTWTTGAPLTLSLSLKPSPTETGTALASAYSQLEQLGGTALAQVVQDMQAIYDNRHDLDTNHPTDNDFLQFADVMPVSKMRSTHRVISTTDPLTITLSVDPPPTQTDSAVVAAYSNYAQACGPALARTKQDGLAVYNGLPVMNISDPKFVAWLNSQDGDYNNARSTCQNLEVVLFNAENNANPQTSTAPASTAGTPTTSTGSMGGDGNPTPVKTLRLRV
ncbi:hypothetical protein FB451DRAFT_1550759 [Mycena latifolia]|nr:hypothetical protein FB451DRAFT_1550759 [Mycena latifolia]